MSNPTPTPQTTTKKPIILISTIIGLVLLSIVAGVVVYQSKMTDTKMANKSSSLAVSTTAMSKSSMANSMNGMSMAENKSVPSTNTNLSKFTDPELPGFSLDHDKSWKHEVTKFEAGNGSGGPVGDFYDKIITLSKDNIGITLNISTMGATGIGIPSCYKKTDLMARGSKYTVTQVGQANGHNIDENTNLSLSSDADFQKYFEASNPSAPIEDFGTCVKSSSKFLKTNVNYKDVNGKSYNDAFFVPFAGSSNMTPLTQSQLKEIATVMDTVVGVSQVNL